MAKQRAGREKPGRRREKRGGPSSGRRKPCLHCKDKIDHVDYKDLAQLRKYISDRGKIRGRKVSGNCQQHQRDVTDAISAGGPLNWSR